MEKNNIFIIWIQMIWNHKRSIIKFIIFDFITMTWLSMKYNSEMHDIFFHFWEKKEEQFHKISAQIWRIFFDTVEKYDFGLVPLNYRRHLKKKFSLTHWQANSHENYVIKKRFRILKCWTLRYSILTIFLYLLRFICVLVPIGHNQRIISR